MLCSNIVKVGMKEANQGSLNAIIKHAYIEQRAGLNPADPAESAGMEDAQIMPSMEVSVSNTGQDINIVLLKDALIMQFRKESVGDTGKGSIRTKNVCMKDAPTAPTKQKQVESAPGMGQSTKSARMKDVQIMPSREESVFDTGQRSIVKFAPSKDAQLMPSRKESVFVMGRNINVALLRDAQK